jgi:D-hydroxyproline dehydrogenase subunit beta
MQCMARGKRVVIVGAGIVGQAHALTALQCGYDVTLVEREGRALGASVRNFGTLWPIGCAFGEERDQALYGVQRWRELADEVGFWLRQQGSLSLAYRDEAWSVMQEFVPQMADGDQIELLASDEITKRFPSVQANGLQGGLFSRYEAVVQPAAALARLTDYLDRQGIALHFGVPVIKVHEDQVELSDGRRFAFDQLVIAAGDDMRTLFPHELISAALTRCRLQMMRTVAQPEGFDLGAVLVSDLTLCHYPAFRECPSIARLRARLDAELPCHREWGVHVIAAQHPDGSLVLGDSHEYGEDFEPESHASVDELILAALREFVAVPDLRIAARWHGVYLKSTIGQTQVVLHPQERVTMVTALGGLGMTLSWGLARQTVASWIQGT